MGGFAKGRRALWKGTPGPEVQMFCAIQQVAAEVFPCYAAIADCSPVFVARGGPECWRTGMRRHLPEAKLRAARAGLRGLPRKMAKKGTRGAVYG